MKLRSLRAISIRAALSPAVATAVATDSFDIIVSDGLLPHNLCGAADHSDPLGTLRKNCLRFPLEMNIYLVSCASIGTVCSGKKRRDVVCIRLWLKRSNTHRIIIYFGHLYKIPFGNAKCILISQYKFRYI